MKFLPSMLSDMNPPVFMSIQNGFSIILLQIWSIENLC